MKSRIYGLPKTHKIGYRLRLVVFFIGSPTHFISQQYDTMLKTFVRKPKSHVKNSFDLKEKLENITISKDNVSISLDVASLYINVAEQLIIESIKKRYVDI